MLNSSLLNLAKGSTEWGHGSSDGFEAQLVQFPLMAQQMSLFTLLLASDALMLQQ